MKLIKINVGTWKCGEYLVRLDEMGGGYKRYLVSGPGVARSRGNDIRTLAEAREEIALAKKGSA